MKIEKAHKSDAGELTQLTIQSKDYWNYGSKQIEAWRDELTIDEKYIDKNQVFKLTVISKLVGFYAYSLEDPKTIKLNFLFITPEAIGKGYGKLLMSDFLGRIKKSKVKRIILDADPHAEKFYQRFGFRTFGKLKSSIPNRFLPIMELEVKSLHNAN